MKNKILLLDSNSLLHRAYHALPPMRTTNGMCTGAIYGFLSILLKLIKEQKPTHIAAAFDVHGGTFRNELYPEYKANRSPMDEDLHVQVEPLKKLLKDMGINVVTKQGFEGDDILGTLSRKFDSENIIVTGDRDMFQLATPNTRIFWTKKGVSEIEVVDLDYLKDMGYTPDTYIDFKALHGDSSDNIPGVAGIGEKGAKKLLDTYGNIQGIKDHLDEIQGREGNALRAGIDQLPLWRKLCEIRTDAPLDITLEDISFTPVYSVEAKKDLLEMEMQSIVKRMDFEEGADDLVLENNAELVEVSTEDEIKGILKGTNEISLYIDSDTIHFAVDNKKEYVISCTTDLFSAGVSFDDALEILKAELKEKVLVCYDYKSLAKQYDITPKSFIDVMIAAHLSKGSAPMKGASQLCEIEKLSASASSLLILKNKYIADLKAKNMLSLLEDVEEPLAVVLMKMEQRGICVHANVLDTLEKKYTQKISELEKEIFRLADCEFNVASPKQMGEILFDKMGLAHGKKTKTGFSVSEEVLSELAGEHPIIDKILEWRHYTKLNSTYVVGLKPLIRAGKIHTEFNQCITATGRLSSTNPNLQNIPVKGEDAKDLKSAFSASSGNVLVSADYSQIELRLLAHFSEDEDLIDAYQTSRDVHATTAATIYGVDIKDVTSDMRRVAKAVNFGIVYGISGFGLSQNINVSRQEAQLFIDQYFLLHPKVKEYLDNLKEITKEKEYSETLLGRRRSLHDINASAYLVRSSAERMALNTPLQGTAADIIKVAMIKVEKRLESMKSKMILQIHDELIIDTAEDEIEQVKQLLKEEMSNAVKLRVPLEVSIETGFLWSDID